LDSINLVTTEILTYRSRSDRPGLRCYEAQGQVKCRGAL